MYFFACRKPFASDNPVLNSDFTEILEQSQIRLHNFFDRLYVFFLEKFYVHDCEEVFHL